jgi:hypothetical protein
MDNYALYINLAGLAVIAVGCLGLIVRAFRYWRKGLAPLMLIGIGLMVTGFPPVYRFLVPIDLGPRERIVDGQRHITLTGWDRNDYTFLGSKHDVAVLQMANHDVTDRTLELLKGMNALKDLDLDNTQVTDAGLSILKDLPALNALHLRNTRITDQGFQKGLAGKESLQLLDLTGTQVSGETAQAWRKAKSGRRVLR